MTCKAPYGFFWNLLYYSLYKILQEGKALVQVLKRMISLGVASSLFWLQASGSDDRWANLPDCIVVHVPGDAFQVKEVRI